MTTQTANALSRALNLMRRMLANPPSAIDRELLDGWTLVMESAGITAEEINRALPVILQTETFFPTPAKFIQAIHPAVDAEAATETAWLRTRDCVRNVGGYGSLTAADVKGDEHALWCIDRMGWQRLCAELGDENGAIWAAEFRRFYRLAVATNERCGYVAGRCEIDNRSKGNVLTPALCGRCDWTELPGGSPKALPPAGGLESAADTLLRELQEVS